MSDTGNTELEKRLAALEKGSARAPTAAQRRSPLLALVVVFVIGAGGALLYLLSQPEEEEALPTATPATNSNVVELVAWGRAPVVIKRAMSLLVL